MEVFSERRKKRFQSSLAGNCQKILNDNIRNSLPLSVAVSSSNLYLVEGKFKVSLIGKTCECNQGYDMVIPCKHICAVLRNNHVDPSTLVSKSYLTTTYYSQYAPSIMPLASSGLLRSGLLPPIARRARGRPRTRRMRAPFEIN